MSDTLELSSKGLSTADFSNLVSKLSERERASVKYLHLDNNNLTKLPGETLKLFPNLLWLDVRSNRLRDLDDLEKPENSQLRVALLQSNPLLRSAPKVLAQITALKVVHLDSSELATQLHAAGQDVKVDVESGIGSSLSNSDPNLNELCKVCSCTSPKVVQNVKTPRTPKVAQNRKRNDMNQRTCYTTLPLESAVSSSVSYNEEMRNKRISNEKNSIEKSLQKTRTLKAMENWRIRYNERVKYFTVQSKIPPLAEAAPFGIDRSALKIMANDEVYSSNRNSNKVLAYKKALQHLDQEISAVFQRDFGHTSESHLAASTNEVRRVGGELRKIYVQSNLHIEPTLKQ